MIHLSRSALAGMLLLPLMGCGNDHGPTGGQALHLKGYPGSPRGGAPLAVMPESLQVLVVDRGGAPVEGAVVYWSASDGGTVTPDSSVTDEWGFALASWRLGWTVGQQQATARLADTTEHYGYTATVDAFRAERLSSGDGDLCAIDAAGNLFCWGLLALPGGSDFDFSVRQVVLPGPVQDAATTGASSGTASSCALLQDHSVWCWGSNYYGNLGLGTEGGSSATPVATLLPPGTYTRLIGKDSGFCAIDAGGGAWCWGANPGGRFAPPDTAVPGQITFGNVTTPTPVAGGHAWKDLSFDGLAICGVRTTGEVYCWGVQPSGHPLGVSLDTSSTPLPVQAAPLADSVAVSGWHQCVVSVQQELWCWGANLNIGFPTDSTAIPYPARLPGPARYLSVHSEIKPTYALGTDGRGYWWGPPMNATAGGPDAPTLFTNSVTLETLATSRRGVAGIAVGTHVVYRWSGPTFPGVPPYAEGMPVP